MKKYNKYKPITITLFLLLVLCKTPVAFAGWTVGGVCLGFGCEGEPIIGNDWLKERWEEIGEGPESALRICNKVGWERCGDQNFIYTFQMMRAGAISKFYRDVNACAATGFSLSEGGHKAAQYIALAYGYPVPDEYMNISKDLTDKNIIDSCEYIFGRSFNQNDITHVQDGVYAKKSDENSVRNAIKSKGRVKEVSKKEIKNIDSNLCLDVQGRDAEAKKPRANVMLYRCDGGSDQQWYTSQIGEIKNKASNLCLDVQGRGDEAKKPRANVMLYHCDGGIDQRWHISQTGEIKNKASNLCLDVKGRGAEAKKLRANVMLYNCDGYPDQKWYWN